MKKLIVLAIFPWLSALFGQSAFAQTESSTATITTTTKDGNKETQEIVIRKKGEKDINLQIQITGDKVLINGKPLTDFKDEEVTIKNKKIIIDGKPFNFNFNDINFDDLANTGRIVKGLRVSESKAILGVYTEAVDKGAKITSLTKDGAAEKAGLKVDDIITKVNKTSVTSTESLSEIISALKPNDEVTVYYKRASSKEKSVKAKLQKRTDSEARSLTLTGPRGEFKSFSFPTPPTPFNPDDILSVQGFRNGGGSVYNISTKQKLGIKVQDTEEENGVTILEVDEKSPAATAGILKNDLLVEFNNKPVKNTDDARKLMQENANNNAYPIKVKREGKEVVLNVKIPKKLKTTSL